MCICIFSDIFDKFFIVKMCSGKTRGVHQSLEHWRTRLEAQEPSGGDVVLGEQDQYHEEECG